jgi:hypothetical protein
MQPYRTLNPGPCTKEYGKYFQSPRFRLDVLRYSNYTQFLLDRKTKQNWCSLTSWEGEASSYKREVYFLFLAINNKSGGTKNESNYSSFTYGMEKERWCIQAMYILRDRYMYVGICIHIYMVGLQLMVFYWVLLNHQNARELCILKQRIFPRRNQLQKKEKEATLKTWPTV